MPAKKKQSTSKAAATTNNSEVDEIQKLADEVFKESGLTGKEQRQQKKDMEKMYRAYVEEQQYIAQQQMYRQKLEQLAMDEEQKVANRTQEPITEPALEKHHTAWQQLAPGKWIRYEQFTPQYMEQLIKLFSEELPEPYSIFTYEHFLSGWPILGILLFGYEGETAPTTSDDSKAATGGELIGSCVSRVTWKYPQNHWRGYIAMLAVRPKWRGHRLGQRLVKVSVEIMKKKKAEEVVLETPVGNDRALKLYTEMGFAKTKYLTRYYLDGSDAIRLKLWFSPPRNQ